jgi:hypothetical protein
VDGKVFEREYENFNKEDLFCFIKGPGWINSIFTSKPWMDTKAVKETNSILNLRKIQIGVNIDFIIVDGS